MGNNFQDVSMATLDINELKMVVFCMQINNANSRHFLRDKSDPLYAVIKYNCSQV